MKRSVVAFALALLATPAFAQSSSTPSPKAQGAVNSAPAPGINAPAGAAAASPQGAGNPSANGNLGSTMAPSNQLPGAGPSATPGLGASPAPGR